MSRAQVDLLAIGRSHLAASLQNTSTPLYFDASLTDHQQTHARGKPRAYLETAIFLLKLIQAETIVEIGAMRRPMNHSIDQFDPVCCNDGHSTVFWASTGLDVHSVDVGARACEIARAACKEYPNARVYQEDGIEFLKRFAGSIDLLFLDAWDIVPEIPYAERHLEAWSAARQKMKPTSLVMIDDTDLAFGGKGRLLISAAIRDGYELLVLARQTILLRQAPKTLRASVKNWIVSHI